MFVGIWQALANNEFGRSVGNDFHEVTEHKEILVRPHDCAAISKQNFFGVTFLFGAPSLRQQERNALKSVPASNVSEVPGPPLHPRIPRLAEEHLQLPNVTKLCERKAKRLYGNDVFLASQSLAQDGNQRSISRETREPKRISIL
jgi:hypothetical protein